MFIKELKKQYTLLEQVRYMEHNVLVDGGFDGTYQYYLALTDTHVKAHKAELIYALNLLSLSRAYFLDLKSKVKQYEDISSDTLREYIYKESRATMKHVKNIHTANNILLESLLLRDEIELDHLNKAVISKDNRLDIVYEDVVEYDDLLQRKYDVDDLPLGSFALIEYTTSNNANPVENKVFISDYHLLLGIRSNKFSDTESKLNKELRASFISGMDRILYITLSQIGYNMNVKNIRKLKPRIRQLSLLGNTLLNVTALRRYPDTNVDDILYEATIPYKEVIRK